LDSATVAEFASTGKLGHTADVCTPATKRSDRASNL
jgi:hypothetical protein